MDSKVFYEISNIHENAKPNERIWTNELAIKYGYPSSEAMRSAFRRAKNIYPKIDIANKNKEISNAKIFVYDLENSYLECAVFELYDQNIGVDQIISQSVLICWSGKFLNDTEIISDCLTPEEALNKNDERIVKSLWEVLNKSDILIGHNIVGFDNKKINLRFLAHGLSPIRKQNIDTYLIAKKYFDFPSNSLKGINQYLGIKQKKENEGFMLWRNCMGGDSLALNNMKNYCEGDVLATSELYYSVRPFIKSPPNLSWFYETIEKRCMNCGSMNLKETGSFNYLSNGKYAEIRCSDCGAIMRSKENLLTKDKRKNLLMG